MDLYSCNLLSLIAGFQDAAVSVNYVYAVKLRVVMHDWLRPSWLLSVVCLIHQPFLTLTPVYTCIFAAISIVRFSSSDGCKRIDELRMF